MDRELVSHAGRSKIRQIYNQVLHRDYLYEKIIPFGRRIGQILEKFCSPLYCIGDNEYICAKKYLAIFVTQSHKY